MARREKKEDLTGRERMLSNVLFSWGGYLVFIVAGFILPRFIDHYVGQVNLGVWDFAWSVVNYFSLVGLGVGTSVNRYVAKFRVQQALDELNAAVSSVVCIQSFLSLLILLLTGGAAIFAPRLFSSHEGVDLVTVRWVIALLGTALAVEMVFDPARGVITGCHRWDWHNAINALSRLFVVIGMIGVLSLGGGLRSLGMVYLVFTFLTGIARLVIAARVCPELQVSIRQVKRSFLRRVFIFGLNSQLLSLSSMFLIETSNLIIATVLGPGSLAVFSRSMALVRHVETFLNKFFFILSPVASSLQGAERHDELEAFLLTMGRYGLAFALPFYCALIIWGDKILWLWMGQNYARGDVLAILAIGYLLPVSQGPLMNILVGMNKHGRLARWSLLATTGSFAVVWVFCHFAGWSLTQAALLVTIPFSTGLGVVTLVYGCYVLKVPVLKYVSGSFVRPIVCNIPFIVLLWLSRTMFDSTIIGSFLVVASGMLVLLFLYWFFLCTDKVRKKITRTIWKKNG